MLLQYLCRFALIDTGAEKVRSEDQVAAKTNQQQQWLVLQFIIQLGSISWLFKHAVSLR